MDSYFLTLVDRLTLDEIEILNLLTSQESTNMFSAMKRKELFSKSNFTEAKFRKVLYKLEALCLIEIVAGNKEHLIYVTTNGQDAIQFVFERSNA